MKALLRRLEEKFNDRAMAALGKLVGGWKESLGKIYYDMEKVKRQKGIKELLSGDMEEMYNAMDDALLLAERMDKKLAKAMGEDVELDEASNEVFKARGELGKAVKSLSISAKAVKRSDADVDQKRAFDKKAVEAMLALNELRSMAAGL